MKKILLLFFLFPITLIAQISPDNSVEPQVPDYVEPSPQAFEFAKYGDVSINESGGTFSHTVPLYNYKSGALSLPISVSYAGNGVKIDQLPTWTGNNWVLNAGGVISRTVKDLPDETSYPRKFIAEYIIRDAMFYQNVSDPDPIISLTGYYIDSEIRELVSRPHLFDTQTDEFNFTFGDYSGSFYLDIVKDSITNIKTITPHILKNDKDLKIEVVGTFNEGPSSHYKFVITTTDGVKYFFGGQSFNGDGSYAIEETQFVDRGENPPLFGQRAKTSFYLTEIVHPLGDRIFFDYLTIPNYTVLSKKNQQLSLVFFHATSDLPYGGSGGGGGGSIPPIQLVKNDVYNGKFLARIWSNRGAPDITFNSFEINAPYQYYRVLSEIDFTTSKIELDYYPSKSTLQSYGNKDHFLLKDIIFKSDIVSAPHAYLNKYKFEYDSFSLSFPSLMSYSQDYLGYFNGENNSNLLPEKYSQNFLTFYGNDPEVLRLLNVSFDNFLPVLANREPNFQYAKKGTLTKIKYPTGGYTTIEYEPVDLDIYTDNRYLSIHSNMGQADPAWNINTQYVGLASIGDPGGCNYIDDVNAPSVFVNQDINIVININTLSGLGLDYHDYVNLEIMDCTTGDIDSQEFHFPTSVMTQQPNTPPQTNFVFSRQYTMIEGHNYVFRARFGCENGILNENNTAYFSSTPMYVNISISEFVAGYDDTNGLGLRVKKTVDFSQTDQLSNVKRYYYNKPIGTKGDSIVEPDKVYSPLFISLSGNSYSIPPPPESPYQYGVTGYDLRGILNSQPIKTTKKDRGSTLYRYVTTSYGGDNFENGGMEKKYRILDNELTYDVNPDVYFWDPLRLDERSASLTTPSYTNFGQNNGEVETEALFVNKNDILFKTKSTSYTYNYSEAFYVNNMAGRLINIYSGNLYDPSHQLHDLYFGLYKTFSYNTLLDTVTIKNFIEPIPLSRYQRPSLSHAWQYDDEDNDGILNGVDPDFLTPSLFDVYTDTELEAPYDKITTVKNFSYVPENSTMPSRIETQTSEGKTLVIKNKYPVTEHINAMSGVSYLERQAYFSLENQYRISSPIESETSIIDENNVETPLSLNRVIYKQDSNGFTQASKVKSAKGNTPSNLKTKYEILSYDISGNPREVRRPNGMTVLYFWTFDRKVRMKIANCTYTEYTTTLADLDIEISPDGTPTNTVSLSSIFPNAHISKYSYEPLTKQLTQITSPNEDQVNYFYNEYDYLQFIKDENLNILQEYEYIFKNQN